MSSMDCVLRSGQRSLFSHPLAVLASCAPTTFVMSVCALALLFVAAGCNMVAGAGRDVTNMSSAVQGWIDPKEGERIQASGGEETLPAESSGGSGSTSSRRASYQSNL